MPAVAALALTLALAPAPTPSTSPPRGPVGSLLGGVGGVVGDLLGGGGDATSSPQPSPTPKTPVPGPSVAPAPVVTAPSTAGPAQAPDRTVGEPADRPAGGGAPGVPASPEVGVTADVPGALAESPADASREFERLLLYALALAVAAMSVLLLRRRRTPAAAPSGASTRVEPAPDLEPAPDNVSRLPTDLNGIYELGRLDERLSQERNRRS